MVWSYDRGLYYPNKEQDLDFGSSYSRYVCGWS